MMSARRLGSTANTRVRGNRARTAGLLVSAAGALAAPSMAQDSVSSGNGLPGDAVSAYSTGASGEQTNNYVVDLVVKSSSWGNRYRVAPLIKASNGVTNFFTHLIASQAASNRLTTLPFVRNSYDAWAVAGQGVSQSQNTAPTDNGTGRYGPQNTAGRVGSTFGVAFMEFGAGPNNVFGDGDDENNIITGVAAFTNNDPSRLYVSRIVSAINKPSATAGNSSTSTLGLGGVDEQGNTHIVADGYALVSGAQVTDKRFIRVAALSRSTAINQISTSGQTDSTAGKTVFQTTTSLTTPTIIPGALAGRPIVIGADFAGNYLFESTPLAMSTSTSYLPAGGSPRGPISFVARPFARVGAPTNVGTGAVLSRDSAATRTRGISVWGVTSNGAVDGQMRAELPTTAGAIIDPTDSFNPATVYGALANQEFTNFVSQVSFRGGNGPVAMTVLPNGDLLAAATVAATGGASVVPQGMDNYIAVARVDGLSGAVAWSIGAHTGDTTGSAGGTSKIIRGDFGDDGVPGTLDAGEGDGVLDTGPTAFIGRIARASELGLGNGPSISSPAMDSLGNLYFLADVSLKKTTGNKFTTALLRANYDGAGGYALEELAEVGDVIAGANSQRNYQVQFMGVADSDSVDSGAVWSGNIVQGLLPGIRAENLAYASPYSLGALVVRCKIVYDRDGNGQFLDPTTPGNSASLDQAYVVSLVLTPDRRPTDFNGDGSVNPDDLGDFITAYFGNDNAAEYNGDGALNPDDLGDFITDYFSGT